MRLRSAGALRTAAPALCGRSIARRAMRPRHVRALTEGQPARQTTEGASEDASGARVGGSVNTPAVLLEVAAFLEPRFPRRAVCVRF